MGIGPGTPTMARPERGIEFGDSFTAWLSREPGHGEASLPNGKRGRGETLGRSRRRARRRLRARSCNPFKAGVNQGLGSWSDGGDHRGDYSLKMKFRVGGFLLFRLLFGVTDVLAEVARVLSVESLPQGFANGSCLGERDQHVGPCKRLQHEPLRARTQNQRRNDDEIDEDKETAWHARIASQAREIVNGDFS